jgi:hypothetical protein
MTWSCRQTVTRSSYIVMRAGITLAVPRCSGYRMKQPTIIVLGALFGALATTLYPWFTRSSPPSAALANVPSPTRGMLPRRSLQHQLDGLAQAPSPPAPRAAETAAPATDRPSEQIERTAPSDRAAAPSAESPEGPAHRSGRAASKRVD